jgi:hypothetical protein
MKKDFTTFLSIQYQLIYTSNAESTHTVRWTTEQHSILIAGLYPAFRISMLQHTHTGIILDQKGVDRNKHRPTPTPTYEEIHIPQDSTERTAWEPSRAHMSYYELNPLKPERERVSQKGEYKSSSK